ncbi:helix-turn-helix domain-containing protein [Alkalihalobacillus sp. NPDC078783]
MFGLGKKRTEFGKMLDRNNISQQEMAQASGVNRTIISKMCNDEEYRPKIETEVKIKKGLEKLNL